MEQKLIITRVYQAAIEMVWKTWTEPELVKKWWGPDKFTCDNAKIDFRVGGVSRVSMRAPQSFGGGEWFNIWEYRKIVLLQRIEFDQRFSDKNGNRIKPVEAGMPADFPEVVFTTVTFEDNGNGTTKMTVTEHGDMGQTARNARLGMEQCMDKIGAIVNK